MLKISPKTKMCFILLVMFCAAMGVMCARHGAGGAFVERVTEFFVIILLTSFVYARFCRTMRSAILLLVPVCLSLAGKTIQIIYNTQFNLPSLGSFEIYLIIAVTALAGITLPFCLKSLRYRFTLYILYGATVVLYVVTLIFGRAIHGVTSWVRIAGISIQLGEMSKLLFIISCAVIINNARYKENTRLALLMLLSLSCMLLLAAQSEIGTIIIMFCIFLSFLCLYPGSMKKAMAIFAMLAVFVGSIGAAIVAALYNSDNGLIVGTVNRAITRLTIVGNLEADPFGAGWQQLQALRAVSAGRLFGSEYLHFIPIPSSDMIFPAFLQIFGAILGITAIACMLAYMLAGINTAQKSNDYLRASIAFGCAVSMFTQSLIIIGGSLSIIPLTGITLPFMSQGGTSLLVCSVMAAIIFRIDYDNTKSEAKKNCEKNKKEDKVHAEF
jgi:cell division protein FtsW